jgi:hypothetical protein
MNPRPITPGFNKHLDIKFVQTRTGQRRALYWSSGLRWLPLPVAQAEAFIAQGQATHYQGRQGLG